MSRTFYLCLACAVGALPVWVWAQNPPSPAAVTVPQASTRGNVVIRNALVGGTASYNDTLGTVVLTKDVTVSQTGEEFFLQAQRVNYSRPRNQATANGNLSVKTRSSTVRGTQLFGDFNTKMLSFTGDVVISAHGKSDGMSASLRDSLNRKPVRIACNRLDWNYATRQATVAGNIRIVSGDSQGTCNQIVYDEPRNIVHLLGNARFTNSKNQQFVGEDLVIYLDEGTVQTPNRITVTTQVEDAPKTTAKPAPKIAIPGRLSVEGADTQFQAPPPISSLLPTPTPAPTAAPKSKTPPQSDANAAPDAAQ